MNAMEKKSLDKPEETRTFPKGKVEVATVGGVTFGRGTFQPGWKWSTSVKPIAKTKSCEAPHLQYHVSGRLHVVMDDGSERSAVLQSIDRLAQSVSRNNWLRMYHSISRADTH